MLVMVLGVHAAGARVFRGGAWCGGDQAESRMLRTLMMMGDGGR